MYNVSKSSISLKVSSREQDECIPEESELDAMQITQFPNSLCTGNMDLNKAVGQM